ncbi:MAG: hypothetical protein HYS08_01850 [Chlamydiae bacterium]|nr:hypothetical protein [Chlamydiota bacterium]MBI3266826.1 hypothetical protein [Chlamydiota bacterium]
MSPHVFFIFFLVCVGLAGALVVLFFAFRSAQKKSSDKITGTEIKTHFLDAQLEETLRSLKEHLITQYQCFKCQGRRYELVPFDEDFQEAYCLACGFKNFYHVDLLAGRERPMKRAQSPWPKEWLFDKKEEACPQCQKKEYSHFRTNMNVKYKFGGYGDRKHVVFEMASCKGCGLTQLYTREAS